MEPVLQVVAMLQTTDHIPDNLYILVYQPKVHAIKLPTKTKLGLNFISPVFLDLGAVFDCLIAPNIPAWLTSNLPGKILLYTNSKVILFVLYTGIFGPGQPLILGGRYPVVDIGTI